MKTFKYCQQSVFVHKKTVEIIVTQLFVFLFRQPEDFSWFKIEVSLALTH